MLKIAPISDTDPYLKINPEPVESDYGKMTAFIANATNTVLHENPGAVAFNATKYFAAGLYGSPLISEEDFNTIYATERPDLKGKWRPGMRYLQADYLLGDSERVEQMAALTGDYTFSALAGSGFAGFFDPLSGLTMGMGGVGGIAKGTSALARSGRALQKVGRFVAPEAKAGAMLPSRAIAGARQGIAEWAATEPLAYVAQDRYLQQERDSVDLAVSFAASTLLPVAAHSLSKRVGPDPLLKRDEALRKELIKRELSPESVDPRFKDAVNEAEVLNKSRLDTMPSRPGIDRPIKDLDVYETEVRSVFQFARDKFNELSASSSDPAVIRRVADSIKRLEEEQIRFDQEGAIGPDMYVRSSQIKRTAASILEELKKNQPSISPLKPKGVGTPFVSDSIDAYISRLEKFFSDTPSAPMRPETIGETIRRVDPTRKYTGPGTSIPPKQMLPVGPDKQQRIANSRRKDSGVLTEKLNTLSVDLDTYILRQKAKAQVIEKTPGASEVAPAAVKDVGTLAGLVKIVERWSGRKVRFYTGKDLATFKSPFGVATLATPDTIYINGDLPSVKAIMHTIGHELYHTLVYQNPGMAIAIEKAVLKMKSSGSSIAQSLEQWGVEAFEELPSYMRGEELTANAVGQMFTSPEFYNLLAKELGSSGFKKVVAYITERLRDLKRLLSGSAETRNITRDLFYPVYKAIESTKEGKAWFDSPDDLLEFRQNHWKNSRRGWADAINAGFSEKYRLDDAFDKLNEDLSVQLPDEAGEVKDRVTWHNNTEFVSNGISIPLTDDLVELIKRNPNNQETLVWVYNQALGTKNETFFKLRQRIDAYKQAAGSLESGKDELRSKFYGHRRQAYALDLLQLREMLSDAQDSLNALKDGFQSSETAASISKLNSQVSDLVKGVRKAEKTLSDYDTWVETKINAEQPAFAWQLRGNRLFMMVSQAPTTGVSSVTLSPFSRAYARASELISSFNTYSREYDGANWSLVGADGKNNKRLELATHLDDLGVFLARSLAGAEPLQWTGSLLTPGGKSLANVRYKKNIGAFNIEDAADRIRENGSLELLDGFIQSREFESIFEKVAYAPEARATDVQVEANRYYTAFLEAIDSFTQRKRAELQADQDPDILASFDSWQDRLKEFHRDSGRFTTLQAANIDLQANAPKAPASTQAQIDKALEQMAGLLDEFKKKSRTNPEMEPAGGSVTKAVDELRASLASETGELPHNVRPSSLINSRHDLLSKIPATIREHYVDTGLADNYISRFPRYAGYRGIAAMRAFWDDLLDSDVDNPMSLFADKKRDFVDAVDRLSETADKLSRQLDGLEKIKKSWPKEKPVPSDVLEDISTKSKDLEDLRSRIVSGHSLIKTFSDTLDSSYSKTPVLHNGLNLSKAQHDAINVLETQYGELEVLKFLQWEGADLFESFDEATRSSIKARYEELGGSKPIEGPEIYSIREGEDVVGGRVLTNELLNDIDDAAQRSAEFGGPGYESAYELDTMPSRKAQEDRIAELGDYAAPTAVKIASNFMADMPKFMAPISRMASSDISISAAQTAIEKQVFYADLTVGQVKQLLDPNNSGGLLNTSKVVASGGIVHSNPDVDEIIRRGFKTTKNNVDAAAQILDDITVYNAQKVRVEVLNAYGLVNLRSKAGSLAELKTWFDGVSRVTKGFFNKAGFENSTRPVNGIIDSQLKAARVEAVSHVQSLINQLPGEVRATPETSATALKAIMGSSTSPDVDPAFKAVHDAINLAIEYTRGRLNRAGAMISKLDGFFMSHRHELSRIEADVAGWVDRMVKTSDWDKISKRAGTDLSLPKDQIKYCESMLNDLRNASVQGDAVAWDIALDNLSSRDRFHRIHEFKSTDYAIDYDMAFGSGDTLNEVVNQIARRAERAVSMENFGPNYVENFRNHLAHLRSNEPKPKNAVEKMLQEWSYSRARHTFEHTTGILNNPVNQRVAAVGQTVRMLSSAAFGWMSTASSLTDLSNVRAALRHMGAQRHWTFVQGLADFALNSSRYPADYRTRLEATGAAYSTLLSAAARGDTEYAGKGFSRKGNDLIYTANLQRRWSRNLQTGFADVFVKHMADMVDHVMSKGTMDESFASYAKFYGLTEDDLRGVAGHIDSVDTDGSGILQRVLMPAEITNRRLRAKFQQMLIDTMDHAILQPSASDTAFLTFGTRAGTVTGELVRTMAQFKGFSLAMNVRMRRRYRAYGMSDLEINRMNVDRLYHAASLLAFGLLSTQIKDALNGKEPLHFMSEDQRTASNVHRVFMQAGLFTALSDLGLDVDYRSGQGLKAGVSTQLLGPAIGQAFRFAGQLTSESPGSGNRAISTLLDSTPGATIPIWSPLKRELFGVMVYEAYGIHLDSVVSRQESRTGQTQLINIRQ